jgi:RHS repeat-associated protein
MSPGIVAESDLSGNLQSEYVFFDGERVARKDFPSAVVSYYFSDHLKTASVITDSAGSIKEDEDYYPWGGELQFANGDPNHYKFTGKERDSETGLDYFGARYYGNWLGRWMSPDWTGKPEPVPYATLADPQTLNLYSYTRNVPTTLIDDDGHGLGTPDWTSQEAKQRIAQEANLPEKEQLKRAATGLCVVFCGPAAVLGGVGAAPVAQGLLGLALASAPVTVPIVTELLESMTPGQSGTLSRAGALGVSTIAKLGENGFVGTLATGAKISAGFEKMGSTFGVNISLIQSAVKGGVNFHSLEANAVKLAQSEGATSLLLKAVNVTKPELANVLTKAGFAAEKITDKFGRETINYIKKIPINPTN